MAIDHVRVYSGLPAGGDTAGIFLTRWVTHFVAPAFCFFAGVGIWFMAKRLDGGAVRRFLVSRGLLLVLLELTLIRFLWAFSVGPDFMLAGVIWMLGWCMVLMAPFAKMRARVGWLGVAIVVLQPLFFVVGNVLPGSVQGVWAFVYFVDARPALGFNVLYVIVPWIGVMLAGYGFGKLLELPEVARHRMLYRVGLGMTAAFLLIAPLLAAMNAEPPADGSPMRALWMRALDQRKYPASPLFLLMTLGPMIALIPWAERAKGWGVRALEMFGRVPMWYYLMHLVVIHSLAVVVTYLHTRQFGFDWFRTAPYTQVPDEGRWSLLLLYIVWAGAIAVLYPTCLWYARRKKEKPARWMHYI